jgi:hypothetical protein
MEVTAGWRKLHREEFRNLQSSPDIIRVIKLRRIKWAGQVAHMVHMRNAYNILVRKSKCKRLLGRPRRRWEGNMKMDLTGLGSNNVDWIHMAQDGD